MTREHLLVNVVVLGDKGSELQQVECSDSSFS